MQCNVIMEPHDDLTPRKISPLRKNKYACNNIESPSSNQNTATAAMTSARGQQDFGSTLHKFAPLLVV